MGGFVSGKSDDVSESVASGEWWVASKRPYGGRSAAKGSIPGGRLNVDGEAEKEKAAALSVYHQPSGDWDGGAK